MLVFYIGFVKIEGVFFHSLFSTLDRTVFKNFPKTTLFAVCILSITMWCHLLSVFCIGFGLAEIDSPSLGGAESTILYNHVRGPSNDTMPFVPSLPHNLKMAVGTPLPFATKCLPVLSDLG